MSRVLFYFFRLPFSRALDTYLTTTTLHLILYTFLNCLSRLLFSSFPSAFKVVGGFGLGLTVNPYQSFTYLLTLILYHILILMSRLLFFLSVCLRLILFSISINVLLTYTNIISYFSRLVKAFTFPFRLPWLALATLTTI